MSRKPTKPTVSGVLPIPLSATRKDASTAKNTDRAPRKHNSGRGGRKPSGPSPPLPKLKLVIRRLPPGLTLNEFEQAIGAEWLIGHGKVDWTRYVPGKATKGSSARPSRAYFRVTSQSFVTELDELVRNTTFRDASNTTRHPCLIGPPYVQYAPYSRIPVNKPRKDSHQGTIDQDSEFLAFLSELTAPVQKSSPEPTVTKQKEEKQEAAITPLIQFLRDKKAAANVPPAPDRSRNTAVGGPSNRTPNPTPAPLSRHGPELAESSKDRRGHGGAEREKDKGKAPFNSASAGPSTKDSSKDKKRGKPAATRDTKVTAKETPTPSSSQRHEQHQQQQPQQQQRQQHRQIEPRRQDAHVDTHVSKILEKPVPASANANANEAGPAKGEPSTSKTDRPRRGRGKRERGKERKESQTSTPVPPTPNPAPTPAPAPTAAPSATPSAPSSKSKRERKSAANNSAPKREPPKQPAAPGNSSRPNTGPQQHQQSQSQPRAESSQSRNQLHPQNTHKPSPSTAPATTATTAPSIESSSGPPPSAPQSTRGSRGSRGPRVRRGRGKDRRPG